MLHYYFSNTITTTSITEEIAFKSTIIKCNIIFKLVNDLWKFIYDAIYCYRQNKLKLDGFLFGALNWAKVSVMSEILNDY